MKTTNKLLLAALIIALVTTTYIMFKVGSFIEIHEVETTGIYKEHIQTIEPFESIVAKNSVVVTFIESDEHKISIETDTAFFKYLVSEVQDQQLILNLDTPLPDSERALITVYSTIPKHIKVEQGAKLQFKDSIDADTIYLDLQRGSKMKIKAHLSHLECYQWEDANINISGKSESLKVRAQHRSKFNGENFVTKSADVTSIANSEVFVFVTGSLSVKASSGGSIKYEGNPELGDTDIAKDGKLIKGD